MPDGREQVRQAYLKLLASIERAIQQLQDRASHPYYRWPRVVQNTPELRPVHRWPQWIPEEWGVCDIYVEHTPALGGLLKSWCVWIHAETPPC